MLAKIFTIGMVIEVLIWMFFMLRMMANGDNDEQ
jgi:hypothetical protein